MNRVEKNSREPREIKREEELLGAMFAAAKADDWDSAPGFEGRLAERLRSKAESAPVASGLIWKAVPVAAGTAVVALVATALTGSFSNLETVVISTVGDAVAVEELITLGLF
jgi:hypothetical protein